MEKIKSVQGQIQESIEKGIKTLEEQHRALASKSFEYAEKLEEGAKSFTVKSLRQKHDKTIDGVYGSVRSFNEKLNGYASDLIEKLEGGSEDAQESSTKAAKAPAKKAPAKKGSSKAAA